MKKKSWNKVFLDLLSDRPIAFIPTLARVSGSANAGLFMSQLLYWWEKGRDSEWIYKTIDEVSGETCLSRREQDTAIANWIKLGVLTKKRAGIPPKRFFHIDTNKLLDLVLSSKQFGGNDKSESHFRQDNTESTAQNTSEMSRIYNTGACISTRSDSKEISKN